MCEDEPASRYELSALRFHRLIFDRTVRLLSVKRGRAWDASWSSGETKMSAA